MSAQKKEAKRYTEIRNSKALHDYFVDERFEAGIQLRGTEVKSIRAGKAQITGAFGRCDKGELWLHNVHIDPYAFGNTQNHEPRRTRKLLLHSHQIRKISQALEAGGRTVVPLRMYFKDALVKVEMGLCTGKKLFDKREVVKKKEQLRELDKAFKFRR
jgi:SsrA-binding protein